jgi:hypothetical protein
LLAFIIDAIRIAILPVVYHDCITAGSGSFRKVSRRCQSSTIQAYLAYLTKITDQFKGSYYWSELVASSNTSPHRQVEAIDEMHLFCRIAFSAQYLTQLWVFVLI